MIELVGGVLLFLTSADRIRKMLNLLTRRELSEDPHDFLATHLRRLAQHYSVASHHFAAFYLLAHGLVKVFLFISLWRSWRWSYPAALMVLLGLIAFQAYRIFAEHSFALTVFTAIDLGICFLIFREWRSRAPE